MLKLLAIQSKKIVAEHYGLTVQGLDSWLHRIRERRRQFRWYLNKILSVERRDPRMKKILLSAKLEEEEEYEL